MTYRGTSPEIRELLDHLRAHGYVVRLAAGSTPWHIENPDGALRAT